MARKENKKRRRIQKQFLVEGEGVQQSFLLKMQAVGFYEVHSWSIEYSGYIGRKSIMLTMVTQGKSIFSGYRELIGRQQLMQRVRRQMLHFAYSRGLELVLETSKLYFGSDHATPDWEY